MSYEETVDLIATKWGDEKLAAAWERIQAERAAKEVKLLEFREWLKSEGGPVWQYSGGGYCNVDNDFDLETLYDRMEASRRCAATCPKCSGLPCRFSRDKCIETKVRLDKGTIYYSSYFCEHERQSQLLTQCAMVGVPDKYCGKLFRDYEVTSANERAIRMVRWYVAEMPTDWLYFGGGCGTGKTFLASLLTKELLRKLDLLWPEEILKTIRFMDMPGLLADLKSTFDVKNESAQRKLSEYSKVEILILDDVGAEQISEWSVSILYQLVNERYKAERRTILTSNYDFKDLKARLGSKDPVQADRIVSRLMEMSQVATFGNCDRRRRSFDA